MHARPINQHYQEIGPWIDALSHGIGPVAHAISSTRLGLRRRRTEHERVGNFRLKWRLQVLQQIVRLQPGRTTLGLDIVRHMAVFGQP